MGEREERPAGAKRPASPAALSRLKQRLRDRGSKADREAAEFEAFAALVDRHADELRELGG